LEQTIQGPPSLIFFSFLSFLLFFWEREGGGGGEEREEEEREEEEGEEGGEERGEEEGEREEGEREGEREERGFDITGKGVGFELDEILYVCNDPRTERETGASFSSEKEGEEKEEEEKEEEEKEIERNPEGEKTSLLVLSIWIEIAVQKFPPIGAHEAYIVSSIRRLVDDVFGSLEERDCQLSIPNLVEMMTNLMGIVVSKKKD